MLENTSITRQFLDPVTAYKYLAATIGENRANYVVKTPSGLWTRLDADSEVRWFHGANMVFGRRTICIEYTSKDEQKEPNSSKL